MRLRVIIKESYIHDNKEQEENNIFDGIANLKLQVCCDIKAQPDV